MEVSPQRMYVANSQIPRIVIGNYDGAGDSDTSSTQYEDESQTDLEMATSNLTLRPDERVKNMSCMSVEIFKHIEDLCHVLQSQCCASDVKLLIFAAAANSEGYRSTLVPIPPLFMGDTFYDIERLRRLIANWPSCSQIPQILRSTESNQLTAGYVHLLHWVLISQANPILRRFKLNRLSGLCKDLHLAKPSSKPQEVLSINYKDERRLAKSKRIYAYLGCPLQFLYRLLIMGRMDNNWAGPLRLYDRADAALCQCTVTRLPLPSNCWSHSRFGRAPRCLLICEVLQERIMSQPEIIIDDTSGLRVRYLLLFTECNKSIECLPSTSRIIDDIDSDSNITRTFTTSSFKSKFSSNNAHRSRGSCGSRWIFRLVGSIMGQVVRFVQRQRTTF
ncbi:uncharacterized protein LOC117780611 [Drosophila innubila]|uniref:uncharacterized protein LOC117780611 n=1 Tax=Drosophila innubila TaxID=198719 RepID=UPI00148D0F40|nr:uncharacterized protein LOC117780611 [Drosophila innubila]